MNNNKHKIKSISLNFSDQIHKWARFPIILSLESVCIAIGPVAYPFRTDFLRHMNRSSREFGPIDAPLSQIKQKILEDAYQKILDDAYQARDLK